MIPTLLRIYWTALSRDRVAQAMTFLLPILFFSIFASVFGNGMSKTARVPVVVVSEDTSAVGRRLVDALKAEKSLRVRTTARPAGAAKDVPEVPIDRARAQQMVKDGDVSVAVVIPAGLDTSLARFDGGGNAITLYSDPSDPIAPQVVAGMLQKVGMTAAPGMLAKNGIRQFERYSGPLTPQQRTAMDRWLPTLDRVLTAGRDSSGRGGRDSSGRGGLLSSAGGDTTGFGGLLKVDEEDLRPRPVSSGRMGPQGQSQFLHQHPPQDRRGDHPDPVAPGEQMPGELAHAAGAKTDNHRTVGHRRV